MTEPTHSIDLPDDAAHVLVVDDDRRIRDLLGRFLRENGYRVTTAEDAAHARTAMSGLAFDLIVLDVMMPGTSGLAFAAELRQRLDTPILMLTARAEPENRIAGLEAGVDDYLPKPFEPRELLLRLNNIARRRNPGPQPRSGEVSFGASVFHVTRGELFIAGEAVKLTERERDMMRLFVARAGETVPREELAALAGHDSERSVDVQINRLRAKIEADPSAPVFLQTVRGRGYVFHAD